MRNKLVFIFVLLSVFCINTFAQLSKDSIQMLFPNGKFVSFKDNIACYRLNGIKKGGMYGFCKYDTAYKPDFTSKVHHLDIHDESIQVMNSACYTIIAPIFDYALPFEQGWAPVCINKKWTYVSEDGRYLFDFVLDAAFPFKNGKAKVIFKGESYEINLAGKGLPKCAYSETDEISISLKAATVNQLLAEAQYEKTLEKGREFYRITATEQNNGLPELSASVLKDLITVACATMSAQNSLMSFFINMKDKFNKYRELNIEHFISFESRHSAINRYNAETYFSSFRETYSNECRDVIMEMDRLDYKSAIVKFEKWLETNNIEIKDNLLLTMTYYYLAELSDDFETSNVLLLSMTALYENNMGRLNLDDLNLGVFLADIKRYQSAESILDRLLKHANDKVKSDKLFGIYYNMALMYKELNNKQKSIAFFSKALQTDIPEEMTALRLECMSDMINLQLACGIVDAELLGEYVNAEIDYNRDFFEKNNSLTINRVWGNSLVRMQRVIEYLEKCNDPAFLRTVFALSVFQQGIIIDADRYLAKTIFFSENDTIKKQYSDFLYKKSMYKGIDVFDMISKDDTERNGIYSLFSIEENIKNAITTNTGHYIPTTHYKKINTEECKNVNMIDIVRFRHGGNLFKFGALLNSSNGIVSYVPLAEYDEFSPGGFWNKIGINHRFNRDEDIYVYYGELDTLGLEYHFVAENDFPFINYRLHRSLSLANLFTGDSLNKNNSAVLYGGLMYGDKLIAETRGAVKGFLEHSETEVDEISGILESKGMHVKVKKGIEGIAASLSELSGNSPQILHLATHGFSNTREHFYNVHENRFNYYRQNTDVQQKEWLMNNTGLFMSLDSLENNSIYANSVASFDLSQTELVVLSACKTLSGDSSDGNTQTIGLTTAFSLASAQNIISSLRDVDDEKTYEFMTVFYKLYAESDKLYDSFRNTVLLMKQKYPDNNQYWSSFVFVEN